MAESMVKLTQLERPKPSPPLHPSPITPSIQHRPTTNPSNALTNPAPPHQSLTFARLPKLEVPLFVGDGVLSWIFQI